MSSYLFFRSAVRATASGVIRLACRRAPALANATVSFRSLLSCPGQDELSALMYELLDAHYDTVQLASGLTSEPCWHAHLEYLRVLQRFGREALAQMSQELVP